MQERREAERLQRDGLAAGVRARDDDRPQLAELEIDRHRCGRVEERVPRAEKDDLVADRHLCAPPRPRESPARDGEVDRPDGLDERDEPPLAGADRGRQLAQDPRDLVALGALRLTEPVRVLDDGERLDEERLARAGAVVDDAGHAPARGRPDREHGPPRARRDEVVLQVLAQPGVTREALEPLGQPRTSLAKLAAEAAKRRRRTVAQVRSVLLDRAVDRLRERAQARVDRIRDGSEAGRLGERLERETCGECLLDRRRDRAKRCGVERASSLGELHRRPNVADTAELRLCRVVEERDGLGRPALPLGDLLRVVGRGERERLRLSRLARRSRREALQNRRKLEQLEGSRVHPGSLGRPLGAAGTTSKRP